ncbi:hypothetical protein FOLKNPGA_00286 [Legionella sp. PC1000]|nr:hypothetical protein FOLKNPGA_00286 [Legionella sp. PC1000]
MLKAYNLCSRAEDVLNAVSHLEKIKLEFYLSTIEVNTSKCTLVQEVKKIFMQHFLSFSMLRKNWVFYWQQRALIPSQNMLIG